ncbi:MAG: type II toxin-antitoxin system PemK/MazF family toxin [Erysipelotrichaceae bacterium]|nr:type II toxin-antitoxin system PemK/MazF family toxin [Erysipelotrichaceae bacterium]
MNFQKFKKGDIVVMDLNPTRGHEQSGYRPVVVISNNDYQRRMGLCIVCPITNNTKAFPTHIMLDNRTKTTGCVLCEHIRTVDMTQRSATVVERIPDDLMNKVSEIVKACL